MLILIKDLEHSACIHTYIHTTIHIHELLLNHLEDLMDVIRQGSPTSKWPEVTCSGGLHATEAVPIQFMGPCGHMLCAHPFAAAYHVGSPYCLTALCHAGTPHCTVTFRHTSSPVAGSSGTTGWAALYHTVPLYSPQQGQEIGAREGRNSAETPAIAA